MISFNEHLLSRVRIINNSIFCPNFLSCQTRSVFCLSWLLWKGFRFLSTPQEILHWWQVKIGLGLLLSGMFLAPLAYLQSIWLSFRLKCFPETNVFTPKWRRISQSNNWRKYFWTRRCSYDWILNQKRLKNGIPSLVEVSFIKSHQRSGRICWTWQIENHLYVILNASFLVINHSKF